VVREPLPEDQVERAKAWREKMLEQLYDFSNELMELALQEEPISSDLIHKVVRDATLHLQIQPVLCGSALHGMGVQPVLDAVGRYLPSPLDMPPVKGTDPQNKDQVITRKPSDEEPFCGLVFKILPLKTGDLYWVRVYSGQLKANTRILNPKLDKKENVAQLWRIHASKRDEQVEAVSAGDIIAVIGLRDSITGDTICDTRQPILLETIEFPETVISMAIEPQTATERKKLAEVLEMMKRQDPTFRAADSGETGQTIISGMGELHLEVIKHKLLRDFNLDVKVHNPRVSYRETVKHRIEVEGECHRQIAGQQLFAKLKVRVEPHDGEQPIVVTSAPGLGLPPEFLTAALEVLAEQSQGGGYLGFPLLGVKITVTGGEAHETESTEVAFRIAAGDALSQAISEDNVVLLEPIMKLEIATPEEYLGDFVGDLQQRRAIIHGTENRSGNVLIRADAPLATLFGYSSAMRSLSQGRASCSMEPSTYQPAPEEDLKRYL
jgi:elongation factor G